MNEINQFGRYFGIIQRETQNHLNHHLGMPQLTATNANFLSFISDYQQVTAQQLATTLSINKGLVSRELVKLEQAGYVRRVPAPDDHRASLVRLTSKGQAAYLQIQKVMSEWWQTQLASSAIEDPTPLLKQLRKLAEAVSGQSQGLNDALPK